MALEYEMKRAKAKRVCQENTLVIANTLFQQHKRRLYTWTSPDGHTEIRLIIFFAAKNLYIVKTNKTRT